MSYIDDLNQAASEALAASASATESSQIIYDVANGDENTTVTTANGEVKTLAKAIADITAELKDGTFNTVTEEVVLSAGQTEVTLTSATTNGMQLYVEGAREFDFTINSEDSFSLSEALPDGTRIWVVGVEFGSDASTSVVTSDRVGESRTLGSWVSGVQYTYDTLADAQSDASLEVGSRVVVLGGASAFDGGGAKLDVVASGGEIPLAASGLTANRVDPRVVSRPSIEALLAVDAYEGLTVHVASYHSNYPSDQLVGEGGFVFDASRSKSDHDGGYVISNTVPWDWSDNGVAFLSGDNDTDPSGYGCWVRLNTSPITPLMFGAFGDFTTDDTAAVNSAIAYAETLTTLIDAPVGPSVVDLASRTYAVSAPVVTGSNGQNLTLRDGGFYALASDEWEDGNAVVHFLGNPRHPNLQNININAGKVANGIHTGTAQAPTIDNVWVYNYDLFGMKCESGMYQLRARNMTIEQMRGNDPDYTDQSKRTGYGLWSVGKGDMEFIDSVISCNKYNVYLQGALHFRFNNCHIFNGSNNSSIQHVDTVNIRFEKGSNSGLVYFDGGYIDNGMVETEVTDGLVFDSVDFLNISDRALNSCFIKPISTFDNQQPSGLRISPTCTFSRSGEDVKIFEFDDGDHSWDVSPLITNLDGDECISMNGEFGGTKHISSANNTEAVMWLLSQEEGAKLKLSSATTTGETSIRATGSRLEFINNGDVHLDLREGGTIRAGTDNSQSLGDAGLRWSEIFSATGTINTSDEREKTEISSLSSSELAVAVKIKALVGKYRWLSSVEDKGDNARWHFGVGAQSVREAFESEGLDGFDYGCLCYDEWEDEDGVERGRYGVRPDELLFFMMAAL